MAISGQKDIFVPCKVERRKRLTRILKRPRTPKQGTIFLNVSEMGKRTTRGQKLLATLHITREERNVSLSAYKKAFNDGQKAYKVLIEQFCKVQDLEETNKRLEQELEINRTNTERKLIELAIAKDKEIGELYKRLTEVTFKYADTALEVKRLKKELDSTHI